MLEQLTDVKQCTEEQKAALEKKVQDRKAFLEDVNSNLERTNGDIALLKKQIETQEMSVNDVMRMESETKGLSEAMERVEAADEERRSKLLESEQELHQRCNDCEGLVGEYNSKVSEASTFDVPGAAENIADFQATFHQDRLLSSSQSDILGVSIVHTVLPALEKSQETLAKETAGVEKKREDALDRVARTGEAFEEAKVQNRIVEDKISKCEGTLEQESQAHERKMAVRKREVEAMESKVSSLRDPVTLEEQKLAYERQLAEYEVLRQQQREEIIAKKRAAKQEIDAGCQLMQEHEEHFQNKMKELEAYWAKKEAAMGSIRVPDNIALDE